MAFFKWDTVGSEQHRSLRLKMQNAHAILFCYDISNASSFKNIESWIKFAERYSVLDFAKIIIGNKIDLAESRVITKGDAQVFKKNYLKVMLYCFVVYVKQEKILFPVTFPEPFQKTRYPSF